MANREFCSDCIEKRKTVPDYSCLFCSLGIKKENQHVDEHGTVHVDIKDIFPDMMPRLAEKK